MHFLAVKGWQKPRTMGLTHEMAVTKGMGWRTSGIHAEPGIIRKSVGFLNPRAMIGPGVPFENLSIAMPVEAPLGRADSLQADLW